MEIERDGGIKMVNINAEYVNPFLLAAVSVLRDFNLTAKMGKAEAKTAAYETDSIIIMIGVTGEMRGQVLISFSYASACDVASKMMMTEVTELGDIATSAICELGNMILGNAATVFSNKGIGIDITPPTVCKGNVVFSSNYAANICIPLILDSGHTIDINVSVKGD